MKFAHILPPLSALAFLTTASPLPTPQQEDKPINFATFKVPHCALFTDSHIESHGSVENGHCISLDWSRSIAYNAPFTHNNTGCVTKFYADDACTPSNEIVAKTPVYNGNEVVDDYYPGCLDDVSVLNTWGGVYEQDLVPLVNLTVTCG